MQHRVSAESTSSDLRFTCPETHHSANKCNCCTHIMHAYRVVDATAVVVPLPGAASREILSCTPAATTSHQADRARLHLAHRTLCTWDHPTNGWRQRSTQERLQMRNAVANVYRGVTDCCSWQPVGTSRGCGVLHVMNAHIFVENNYTTASAETHLATHHSHKHLLQSPLGVDGSKARCRLQLPHHSDDVLRKV